MRGRRGLDRNHRRLEADGELKKIYQGQAQKAGALANILKIHSLAPRMLSTHMALYEAVMHAPGDLSRAQREMIAVVVSSLNRCHY
jgi:alkylhydroperoxidase family enzyme